MQNVVFLFLRIFENEWKMTNYPCLLKPSQLQSHRIPRLSKPLASILLHRVVVLRLALAPVSGGSCRRRAADPAGRARGPATVTTHFFYEQGLTLINQG